MKKLFVYSWGGFTDSQLLRSLGKLGIEYVYYAKELEDYHRDAEAAREMMEVIRREKPEGIFSYNYIPLLSILAEIHEIPYISWIYDCPHYTVLSETLAGKWNYIFCFDGAFAEELIKKGARNVYHFPLGVDVEDMEERIAETEKEPDSDYGSDIAFIGSLYNGNNNRVRNHSFSDYTRGYLDGIIEAQLLIYGACFIPLVLEEEVLEEIVDTCKLRLGEGYRDEPVELAAGMVDKEVTARERERILAAVAKNHRIHVYTGSEMSKHLKELPGLINKGFADTRTQMPAIFHHSRINLNITLKSIRTGIPQRVLDIMACGGFCLTNYQAEIAAFFEDGEELVMYSSIPDLCDKIDYYLKHEEEREAIAKQGKEKIKQLFDLPIRLKRMMEMIEGELRG